MCDPILATLFEKATTQLDYFFSQVFQYLVYVTQYYPYVLTRNKDFIKYPLLNVTTRQLIKFYFIARECFSKQISIIPCIIYFMNT